MRWRNLVNQFIPLLFTAVLLSSSVVSIDDPVDRARQYTAPVEYDYVRWLATAMSEKSAQAQLNAAQRLSPADQSDVVRRYFELIRELEEMEAQIQRIYTDPSIEDPESSAAAVLRDHSVVETALADLAPLAESILQAQVMEALDEEGIGFLSQAMPPVLFHSSPLPKALIVSPRDTIRQEVNISLLANLSLEDITRLENRVEKSMDASALVVDVGGIGVYPTMVQRSSSLEWTIDTIAHEWTHNYLTLHPLGLNYDTTPELRTMNETTASIVGSEISRAVLEKHYPELATSGTKTGNVLASPEKQEFDFRREMHLTRIKVDELLSKGLVDEAETYMEQRRIVFVEHGYMIRKLNQAYFAFHGAYADTPGGAAGEDPVGPAVRELRQQSATLAEFLRTIAWMNSFEDLQQAIQ